MPAARTSPRAAGARVIDMTGRGPLRVFAAGSLRAPLDALAAAAPGTLELDYANARALAQRIEAGEPADVFASASAEHPRALYEAGLVGQPRRFASNRLVVAVRAVSAARDVAVLADPRTRVVIEVEGIPLGDYTRALLARLDVHEQHGFARRVLANVVAQEHSVDTVAARLLAGDADAAILYATDVVARSDTLRAIELPPAAALTTSCHACVVSASATPARALDWVDGLTAPPTLLMLRQAGFGPP